MLKRKALMMRIRPTAPKNEQRGAAAVHMYMKVLGGIFGLGFQFESMQLQVLMIKVSPKESA